MVPFVVGDDPEERIEQLEAEGWEVTRKYRITTPDDDAVGSIVEQEQLPGDVAERGRGARRAHRGAARTARQWT